jgi:hypothetical protein
MALRQLEQPARLGAREEADVSPRETDDAVEVLLVRVLEAVELLHGGVEA